MRCGTGKKRKAGGINLTTTICISGGLAKRCTTTPFRGENTVADLSSSIRPIFPSQSDPHSWSYFRSSDYRRTQRKSMRQVDHQKNLINPFLRELVKATEA